MPLMTTRLYTTGITENDCDCAVAFSPEQGLQSGIEEYEGWNSIHDSSWENSEIVDVYISTKKETAGCDLYRAEIRWTENSELNYTKVWDDCSKAKAAFEAIFIALRQAICIKQLPRIIVRTNSEYICNIIIPRMPKWKKDDFLTSDFKRLKNADYLEELGRLLELIEAKFVFSSLSYDSFFSETKVISGDENKPSTYAPSARKRPKSSDKMKVVYVSGALMPHNNLEQWRLSKGACGVFWSPNDSKNVASRVSLFPATRNRCHLQAIIIGLEKAVKFEYVTSDDPNMEHAINLARNALLDPKVFLVEKNILNEAKTSFDTKTLEDGFIRVRICCDKIDGKLWYGDVWENSEGVLTPHVMNLQARDPYTKNLCHTLLYVLKRAEENGIKKLVLRISSKRIIEILTYWVPKWRKNDWRTVTNKPLKYGEIWKELDCLLNVIKTRWEYDNGKECDEFVAAVDLKASNSFHELILLNLKQSM
uniref:RNase H domain-containing protein n=1 Tax=Syphacia muris TaxID=451379 RepID=A0A0N5A9M7_9BILA